MMKTKISKKIPSPSKPRNFVAKHSRAINKPQVFKDKKKDYVRHDKHKLSKGQMDQEPDLK